MTPIDLFVLIIFVTMVPLAILRELGIMSVHPGPRRKVPRWWKHITEKRY
jgi:hypothetical protein